MPAARLEPLLAGLLGSAGAVGEAQLEFLQGAADQIAEDMGGGSAKWLVRASAEELKEAVQPLAEEAGYEGGEEAITDLCIKALSPETLVEQAAAAAAAGPEPAPEEAGDDLAAAFAGGDTSLEAIWGAVQALDGDEFAILQVITRTFHCGSLQRCGL